MISNGGKTAARFAGQEVVKQGTENSMILNFDYSSIFDNKEVLQS